MLGTVLWLQFSSLGSDNLLIAVCPESLLFSASHIASSRTPSYVDYLTDNNEMKIWEDGARSTRTFKDKLEKPL